MSGLRPRRRERGQAFVETVALLPLILMLFMGVYAASELLSDENMATSASRNAARIGADIGNNGYQPGVTPTDPTAEDQTIVAAVNAALTNQVSSATITEVDVYQPKASASAGYFDVTDAGMYIDRYAPNGNSLGAGAGGQYGLDKRSQIPGQVAEIGVRVVFQFSSPNMVTHLFAGTHAAYSVYFFPPA